MHRAVLLTLGRLPKGLELARCLHRAGWSVYVADPFATHLSMPSRAVKRSFRVAAPNHDLDRFNSDILSIIEQYGITHVAPVSEEALYVARLADRFPPSVTLLTAPFDALIRVHDKLTFIETARSAGLPAPETHVASSAAAAALARRADYVVKPRLGCSGMGLRFGAAGAPLAAAETSPATIVQERVRGRELSSLSFVREGAVLGGVLYEGRVFAGTVATNFARVDDAPAVEAWIAAFTARTGWTGFIAFDFIADDDGGVWPIECNPRLTSGVHFFDHDDLAAAIAGDRRDGDGGGIKLKPQGQFQEGHTTLVKVYEAMFRPRLFARRLGQMLAARDVLWSWRDPAPFLLMTPASWPILAEVIFKGAAFGEAATRDIEWRPPQATGPGGIAGAVSGAIPGTAPAAGAVRVSENSFTAHETAV